MLRSQSSTWPQSLNLSALILFFAGTGIILLSSFLIGKTDLGLFVLAGLIAVVGGCVIMIRPNFGLYILVFFIFTNMSDVLETAFGIPDTNKPLVALIFVGTLASQIVLHNKPLVFRSTEISILIYGVVVIVTLAINGVHYSPYAIDPQPSVLELVIDWFKDFMILFIIVQQCTREDVWKKMQWTLIASATLLSLLSTYQNLTGDTENDFYGLAKAPTHEITEGFDSTRVTGPLDDPNFYAMILLIAMPMATYRVLTEKDKVSRTLALIAALLIAMTIIFTYSRGAFLALTIVGILIVRERKISFYKVGAVVVVVGFLVTPILPAGFTDRIATLTSILPGGGLQNQTEVSFRGRSSEALVAIQMFFDHPIIGVGRENYANRYLDYSVRLGLDNRLEDRQAHSLYLEVAAESGIVGIIAFGWMLIILFMGSQQAKVMMRQIKREDLVSWISGIQLGLVGYLLASIFLHGDYSRYFWMAVAFVASTTVMAEAQVRDYETYQKDQSTPEYDYDKLDNSSEALVPELERL